MLTLYDFCLTKEEFLNFNVYFSYSYEGSSPAMKAAGESTED